MTTSATTAPQEPPHVVMIVGNDVTTDTRVKKTAIALSRAGLRVTIVGYAPGGTRSESWLGDCRIIRVPVAFRLRDERARARARRRKWRPPLGYPTPAAEQAALLRVASRERELGADYGSSLVRRDATSSPLVGTVAFKSAVALRKARRAGLKARRTTVQARSAVQRRVGAYQELAWKGLDKYLGAHPVGVRWRSAIPEIIDYELAFGPVIDQLAPDVIHAHDFHMVGIAADAVGRARARGRRARWVYDAHEFVHGLPRYGGRTKAVVAAYEDLEREYVRDAERIVTVSEPIADELQRRYHLRRRPDVVMNIPVIAGGGDEVPSVRRVVGLDDDTPLIVYSGGVTPARGVVHIIEALPHLPGVHFALVAVPPKVTPFVQSLLNRAKELDVAERVHIAAPVGSEHVVAYLSAATVGVHPMLKDFEGHDMALPNKLFEYLHAGLPVVVSDCRAMADFVTRAGMGEVFPSGDSVGLAGAVSRVLADRQSYVDRPDRPEVLARYTWGRQAAVLRDVYRDLLGADRLAPEPIDDEADIDFSERPVEAVPAAASARTTRLGIGPANMAGQAWAWAKAVERHLGVETEVLAVEREKLDFPADRRVAAAQFARDHTWQVAMSEHVLSAWTHVLLEAGRPVMGTLHGRDFTGDVPVLRGAGVQVGLVFHGSEIRDPRRHAERNRWSPFRDPEEALTARLQKQVDALAPKVAAFDGPKYVSTPDLLHDVEGAEWLPVVVDVTEWRADQPPLERRKPVVVHAPSNTALKGTRLVEEALEKLVARDLVDYRRIQDTPPADMPRLLADADIVLDQFTLGSYGVLACQAMAMGRVTVGHVTDDVRGHIEMPVPIFEATPDNLAETLERILDDRDQARSQAAQGPVFVARYHDGAHAAATLAAFLGVQG